MAAQEAMKRLLNASGFAFQLGIEELICEANDTSFSVTSIEHRWFHSEEKSSGFIDLVLEAGSLRIVMECKRTKDATWLFLIPDTLASPSIPFRCYWTIQLDLEHPVAEWGKIFVEPESQFSQFCSIRGMGENQVSALDRIGSELVTATEALAASELKMTEDNFGQPLIYVPVIVTNAEICVAEFDPSQLDLKTGKIEEVNFEKRKWIRYIKALGPNSEQKPEVPTNICKTNDKNQRSVFVVNSNSLVEFLNQIKLRRVVGNTLPWENEITRFHQRRL